MNRTYAVIVALESYPHLGDGWKLPGVAAEAAEFANWLVVDRHVPPANVRVYLSGGDRAVFTNLGIPPAAIDDATSEPLNQFLAGIGEVWPDGEVLFLYWAGHGFVSRDGRRRLILSDATATLKVNLDLEQLRLHMATDRAGKLKTQFFFFDACARHFEELQSRTELPAGGLNPGSQVREVTQNFYLAAASGELATKGTFGPEVTRLLREVPAGDWPPNQRWLRNRIEERFDELVAQQEATQQPIWLEFTVESGKRSQRGVLPTLDYIHDISWRAGLPLYQLRTLTELAAQCTTLTERSVRDELYQSLESGRVLHRPKEAIEDVRLDLMRLIAGSVEQDTLSDLVQRIIERESNSDAAVKFEMAVKPVAILKQVWPILAKIRLPLARALVFFNAARGGAVDQRVPTSLPEILELLLDRSSDEPLIDFLLRAAREWPDDPNCRMLTTWVRNHTGWVEIATRIERRIECEKLRVRHLLIDVDGQDNDYRITRAWLWAEGTGEAIDHSDLPQDLTSGLAVLLNKIDTVPGAVYVELLLPEGLFHLERGRLGWKNRGKELDLECLHPISLRLRERMVSPRDPLYQTGLWKKTAAVIKQRLKANRRVYWVDPQYDLTAFRLEFERDETGEIFGIPFSSEDDRNDLLALICNAGLPFACWPRSSAVDFAAAEPSLREIVAEVDFEQLPEAFCPIRHSAEPLAHVLLLWDDPSRDPYQKYSDLPTRT